MIVPPLSSKSIYSRRSWENGANHCKHLTSKGINNSIRDGGFMADRGQHTKIVDSLRSHICKSSTLTLQVSAVPTSIYIVEEERCELLGKKSDNHSGAVPHTPTLLTPRTPTYTRSRDAHTITLNTTKLQSLQHTIYPH